MSTASGYNGASVEEGTPRFHVAPRDEDSQRVIKALQKLYRKKLRPTEEAFSFGSFHYEAITDTELEAKSQVLVIGQYSTGKTTFIRHLLGADFPNMNIGPEPTSDKFTVVMHGEQDLPVEGNSLAVIKELPYEGLTQFGTGLLNKLNAAVSTSPFLENITLVDTPGVLSGEMQRHQRAYHFADVARWFADRSDMILILFDAHRLDVSDELMEILTRLVDHQHMIRIVLNKADQVDKATLRRVYGALMWSMGKVFDNPEVVRVYVGSFWDKPLKYEAHHKLFKTDQDALTQELTDLPRLSAVRKINQFIKRTKLLRAHVCILSYLGEQMPWLYGRAKRRQELLDNMEGVLETVRAKHGLHDADMPDPETLRAKLQSFDFTEFPVLTPAVLRRLNDVVDVDVHQVLREGGGSAKFFKFSRSKQYSSKPGLLSRAGSSLRSLFVSGGATTPGSGSSSSSRNPISPSPLLGPFDPIVSPYNARSAQSNVTEIGYSGHTGAEAFGAGVPAVTRESPIREGGRRGKQEGAEHHRKRAKWTCCGMLQVLLLLLGALVLFLFVVESMLVSAEEAPLHSAARAVRQQAHVLFSRDSMNRLLTRVLRGKWNLQLSEESEEGEEAQKRGALFEGPIM